MVTSHTNARAILLLLGFLAMAGCAPAPATSGGKNPDKGADPSAESMNACESGSPLVIKDPETMRILPRRSDQFCAIVLTSSADSLSLIESGSKMFEYRKSHPSDRFSHIVFYRTPAEELYGVAEVVETLAGNPDELADRTWRKSGTNRNGVRGYFTGSAVGYAIEIRKFRKFTLPVSLAEARRLEPTFRKPNGYVFLERTPALNKEIEKLSR